MTSGAATPVLVNTGVKHAMVADGCAIGSSLKADGRTWNAVDPHFARKSRG
ncbi:BtpA/SgcQ family protein [Rhizobium sp. YJ-22]|nr:BtpA/SgcQ family protein [Rhizobium sp. YJ-22]MDG3579215.1 BtpA/SgcQ family protein [Rhizobium sp. YJ-22]